MDRTSMEVAEKHPLSGYALGPPWLFKGSALYQLHLVKAETARTFIPKEFKLVEAFGYTLGGFFLAHYDDSPAAMFDELVVIAGIVWNPPTSCAWAARVIVNSHEACRHGKKEVGLPSHVGIFCERSVETREEPLNNKLNRFLNMIGINSNCCVPKECTKIEVFERRDSAVMSLCSISLPYVVPKSETNKKWMGPKIRMLLPSFSGRTQHNPHLLKYCCQIDCRIRAVNTAKISGPGPLDGANSWDENEPGDENQLTELSAAEENEVDQCISVLLSKPILALQFNLLKMQVEAPTVVDPHSKKPEVGDSRT
ncbi:uncharacterized protein A4U43_C03F9800 [Asparagus officinalis]|uniref:Protein NEOXANTHIN-DEFICIENT 1 n=1 Tax=Asparagus officinalis TaxID=4686 RepID=A0A5P1FAJ6_ASPOF|nr:protein NEOXANTHIN-DEFICIENT 1 [Asparagus officinalis]XP_020256559.1 protein NEOXANTHIN-DEFICIENT 1 [Asparagus officinalis]XP_020256560.1 protein NEOXANTHIN-DEFICIENT 1 [Asparagus officinalis]ONK74753.1 uncharacterized protein A4U43_C03F9800 [Asparagus officinalis]